AYGFENVCLCVRVSVCNGLFLKSIWTLLHKFRLECVGCRAHRCLVHRSGDSGLEAKTETPYQMWLCSNLGTLGNHFAHRTAGRGAIAQFKFKDKFSK